MSTFSIKTLRHYWSQPCLVCGLIGDTEVDHIIPRSRGGSGTFSNAQPLCRVCNMVKRGVGHSTAATFKWIEANRGEFLRRQDRRINHREAVRNGAHAR